MLDTRISYSHILLALAMVLAAIVAAFALATAEPSTTSVAYATSGAEAVSVQSN